MTMTFGPTIVRGGARFVLPGPILQCRVADRWDFQRFKVPLTAGVLTTGLTRDGVEISIRGHLAAWAGAVVVGEVGMLDVAEQLRQAADTEEGKFVLELYRDGTTGAGRGFADCTTARLDLDFSDPAMFTYALLVHADDPRLLPLLATV